MTITILNSGGGPATGAAGVTDTSSPSVTSTAASLAVILGGAFNEASAIVGSAFTDSKSNTYTLADGNDGGVNACNVGAGYNDGGTRGTTHTFSFNAPGGGEFNNCAYIELSGHVTPTPFNATYTGKANGTTTACSVSTGATVTTSVLLIAVFCVDTGNTGSWPTVTGWTKFNDRPDGASQMVGAAYYKAVASSGATETCNPTYGAALNSWRAMVVAVKDAGVAGGPGFMSHYIKDAQTGLFRPGASRRNN